MVTEQTVEQVNNAEPHVLEYSYNWTLIISGYTNAARTSDNENITW